MNGRTIKIFLVEGDPTGLRTVEVGLSTLKAVISPRAAIERLKGREEASRTGVYLLLGDDDSAPSRIAVYVGEGDSVIERLISHDSKKDFWHTATIFTSKDDNLNKAHARWLEAELIKLADKALRAKVVNDQRPEGGKLSESDIAEMQEVISQIRMVLGAVGFDVFSSQGTSSKQNEVSTLAQATQSQEPTFAFSGTGFNATMKITSRGYVVTKGSLARIDETPSLQQTYRSLRASLLQNGILRNESNGLHFTSDYEFNSPSAAASVVGGGSNSGGVAWKLQDGKTFWQWEREREDTTTNADAES